MKEKLINNLFQTILTSVNYSQVRINRRGDIMIKFVFGKRWENLISGYKEFGSKTVEYWK